MKNILVIRLSALGDVAISVHVVRAVIEQNPKINLIILTRKAFQPLFSGINRVSFIEPDLYGKHKNIFGLFRLFNEINSNDNIHSVIDIHNVIRSKILRLFYFAKGIKSYKINKGRAEKKHLLNKKNKKQLKTSIQRYIDVFEQAGIKIDISKTDKKNYFELSEQASIFTGSKDCKWIGIAPFAFYKQKMYPIEKMENVIELLLKYDCKIFLFGGGKKEKKIAVTISKTNKNIISLIGKFSLHEEIAIISQMDSMLTMDSANMHLAALTQTNIVSIWGATHPYAGFTAFVPEERNKIIQNKKLECRPCSIYGIKECERKDLICMEISPEIIVEKLLA